jgi:hypothetical protein
MRSAANDVTDDGQLNCIDGIMPSDHQGAFYPI